jgi:hypothetical protein
MAGFLTPLELEYLDGHLWKVTSPFEYCIGSADSTIKVVIPTGFFTDFASVPRVLWSLFPPTGVYGKAAVVHDWLYQTPSLTDYDFKDPAESWDITRKECDDILKEAMEVLTVGLWTCRMVYSGVRMGGWKPWNEYRSKG